MWTRKELKAKAKKTFSANYWKTVLVSLILTVIIGGAGSSFAANHFNNKTQDSEATTETMSSSDEIWQELSQSFNDETTDGFEFVFNDPESFFYLDSLPTEAIIVISVIVVLVVLIAITISILVKVFLNNPLEVGCKRFFIRNLNQEAKVGEVAYAFDHNYATSVKTIFLRDIYVVLWTLLLVIPGIIKAYEYLMIPYILADHPEMTKEEVFAKSKELMNGQKWNAFVLHLSFIGWEILSLLTFGILGIFYVNPYKNMTFAGLYEKLEYGNLAIEEN